jgi:DNA-binding NarL/FixJ family response regulator
MERLTTFIVEDSAIIRENLIATLHELVPIEVVGTAEDDVTAIRWLEERRPRVDLLILDMFLKRGSGLGVLRALRACAGLPQVGTTVVLSNYATEDMRRACLALGADKVFDKSREIEELILYCDQLATGGDPGRTMDRPP